MLGADVLRYMDLPHVDVCLGTDILPGTDVLRYLDDYHTWMFALARTFCLTRMFCQARMFYVTWTIATHG